MAAWALMMQAFPGAFTWVAFAEMPLDVYAESYRMAVEILEAKAEAIRKANGG